MAADFVDRKVDLIVAGGGHPSALAAKNATSTIPIVFTSVGDPVGAPPSSPVWRDRVATSRASVFSPAT